MNIKTQSAALLLAFSVFSLAAQETPAPEPPTRPSRPEQPERPERPTSPIEVGGSANAEAVLEVVSELRAKRGEFLAAQKEIVLQFKGSSVEDRAALRAELKANREAFRAVKEQFRGDIKEAAGKLKEHARKLAEEDNRE